MEHMNKLPSSGDKQAASRNRVCRVSDDAQLANAKQELADADPEQHCASVKCGNPRVSQLWIRSKRVVTCNTWLGLWKCSGGQVAF